MPDREKVIKELHDARRYLEDKEWSDRGASPHIDAINDALALLKEHEQKEVTHKSKRIKFLDEYFEGECPSCRSPLDEHSNRNFCGYCGQAVKWDA